VVSIDEDSKKQRSIPYTEKKHQREEIAGKMSPKWTKSDDCACLLVVCACVMFGFRLCVCACGSVSCVCVHLQQIIILEKCPSMAALMDDVVANNNEANYYTQKGFANIAFVEMLYVLRAACVLQMWLPQVFHRVKFSPTKRCFFTKN